MCYREAVPHDHLTDCAAWENCQRAIVRVDAWAKIRDEERNRNVNSK